MSIKTSRREFIRTAPALGAGVGFWIAGSASAKPPRRVSANEKLDIAMVGTANQAGWDLSQIQDQNIVALCDVDADFLAKAAEKFPHAQQYRDYRRLMDDHQRFDAVLVAIPDHQHVQAALRALKLGKHVYCEKPLAHTLHEVRLMINEAERQGVATQMGTQIHAKDNYRRVVEKIQSGAIGDVYAAHVWVGGVGYSGAPIPKQEYPVPTGLNWDVWLGPADWRHYKPKIYHPFRWRGWWDFGGGSLSDLACHYVDIVHWSLDLPHPVRVQAFGADPMPHRCPRSLRVEYDYPADGNRNALKLTWYHGGAHIKANVYERFGLPEDWSGNAILFVGTNGNLLTDYTHHILLPQDKFADYKAPTPWIPSSIGHHAEWIKACKEGTPTLCNFNYSGRLTESVLLGLVSHRAGNVPLEFDADNLLITNNRQANQYLTKQYRPGWELERIV